jgi:hypothetical protein
MTSITPLPALHAFSEKPPITTTARTTMTTIAFCLIDPSHEALRDAPSPPACPIASQNCELLRNLEICCVTAVRSGGMVTILSALVASI